MLEKLKNELKNVQETIRKTEQVFFQLKGQEAMLNKLITELEAEGKKV